MPELGGKRGICAVVVLFLHFFSPLPNPRAAQLKKKGTGQTGCGWVIFGAHPSHHA